MDRLPAIGLRGRLAMSIAMIMLAALSITYLAVYRGTGSELRDRTESDLEREVERLATSLSNSDADSPAEFTARARNLVQAESFGPSSRVISISIAGGGTVTNQPDLFRSLDQSGQSSPGPGGQKGEDQDRSEEGQEHHEQLRNLLTAEPGLSTLDIDDVGDVRLLASSVPLANGNGATIRVGQPLASVDRALEGLSQTFVLVGLATLLLAAGAGWLLASRTTRPMRTMADVAEGVDGGDLSARMPISETRNDEVRRLAESFNHMLDRLEDAFDRQRAFVADASHDLRTPLTIVNGQLEVLARDPDPGPEEVRRVTALVTAATGRMESLVDDLLMLARAESGVELRSEPSELGPLISAEVEGFMEAHRRSFEIGEVSDRQVMIDRESMARVTSNLISNAVRHTEPEGKIRVSAVEQPGRVEIVVEDDGPGVPPELRSRVFDRFARLDSSRSSDSGGSGLGLAIVKAMVESQGGSVACGESPLGGASFTVSLPEAPPVA